MCARYGSPRYCARGQQVCLNEMFVVNAILNGLENDLKFQGTLVASVPCMDLYSNTIN